MKRKEHDELHRHEPAVSGEFSCSLLALRSGLFLRHGDQLECAELCYQPAAEQRILLD